LSLAIFRSEFGHYLATLQSESLHCSDCRFAVQTAAVCEFETIGVKLVGI